MLRAGFSLLLYMIVLAMTKGCNRSLSVRIRKAYWPDVPIAPKNSYLNYDRRSNHFLNAALAYPSAQVIYPAPQNQDMVCT